MPKELPPWALQTFWHGEWLWVEVCLTCKKRKEKCELNQGVVDPHSSSSMSKVKIKVVYFWPILLEWEKGDVVIIVMTIKL
jgi:hypothetical protein